MMWLRLAVRVFILLCLVLASVAVVAAHDFAEAAFWVGVAIFNQNTADSIEVDR